MECVKLRTSARSGCMLSHQAMPVSIRALPCRIAASKTCHSTPADRTGNSNAPMAAIMPAGFVAALVAVQTLPAHAAPLMAVASSGTDVDAGRLVLALAALGFAAVGIINWQQEQARNSMTVEDEALTVEAPPLAAIKTAPPHLKLSKAEAVPGVVSAGSPPVLPTPASAGQLHATAQQAPVQSVLAGVTAQSLPAAAPAVPAPKPAALKLAAPVMAEPPAALAAMAAKAPVTAGVGAPQATPSAVIKVQQAEAAAVLSREPADGAAVPSADSVWGKAAASARGMQAAYSARLAAVREAAVKRQEQEARRWRQHAAALANFRSPQVPAVRGDARTPSPVEAPRATLQALVAWLRAAVVALWAALQATLPRRIGGGGSAPAGAV